jgi:hypothetical protein
MKRLLLSLLVCSVLLPGLARAQAIGEAERPAVEAAKAWLALIDAGDYVRSWQGASTFFRGLVTEKNWTAIITGVRAPLGAVVSRTETTATSHNNLPGVPDGQYVVITFATAFANKESATETVTFMKDTDGAWRAAGYFIR